MTVISLICLFALFVQSVNHFDYVQATIQNIAKSFNNQTEYIKEYTQWYFDKKVTQELITQEEKNNLLIDQITKETEPLKNQVSELQQNFKQVQTRLDTLEKQNRIFPLNR